MLSGPALYFVLICLTALRALLGHFNIQHTVDIFTALLCGIEQQSGNYMMTGSSAPESDIEICGESNSITNAVQSKYFDYS